MSEQLKTAPPTHEPINEIMDMFFVFEASEVKTRFDGVLADIRTKPAIITKNGEPVAGLLEYAAFHYVKENSHLHFSKELHLALCKTGGDIIKQLDNLLHPILISRNKNPIAALVDIDFFTLTDFQDFQDDFYLARKADKNLEEGDFLTAEESEKFLAKFRAELSNEKN